MNTIYTIGHSTHTVEFFIGLLKPYGINCIVDVRTSPYSRMAPQFNKEALIASLKQNNIRYAHFDKEFGARHSSPILLDAQKKVDFDKVRETPEFKAGIARLKEALNLSFTIALMCSEADPFDCHRFSMISYQLVREGFDVLHVLKDGNFLKNTDLEEQLLKKYQKKLPQTNLFEVVTKEQQLEIAYRLRGRDVAFSPAIWQSEKEEIPLEEEHA